MITKEDFNKVWKDSTKEAILNQFYYEHIDLIKLTEDLKEYILTHKIYDEIKFKSELLKIIGGIE